MNPLAAQPDDLPVTRVVLFRSGVGYVERSGSVEGEASLTLHFRPGPDIAATKRKVEGQDSFLST